MDFKYSGSTGKKYAYIGTDADKPFDKQYFDSLIDSDNWTEAYTYGSSYMFEDKDTQKDWLDKLNVYKANAEKREGFYNRIDNIDSKRKLELYEAKLSGFDNFVNKKLNSDFYNGDRNKLYKDYPLLKKYYDNISYITNGHHSDYDYSGSRYDSDYKNQLMDINNPSDLINIRFQYKKYGSIIPYDFLAKDTNEFDEFLTKMGWSKDKLSSLGIGYTEDKGTGDVILGINPNDKNLPYILNNLPTGNSYLDGPQITSYKRHEDDKGNETWQCIGGYNFVPDDNKYMRNCVRNIREVFEEIDNNYTALGEKTVSYEASGSIIPLMTDGINRLNKDFAEGKITPSEYNSKMKYAIDYIGEASRSMQNSQFIVYSDYENEDGVQTLKMVEDQTVKTSLQTMLSAAGNDVTISGFIGNGEQGIHLTIPVGAKIGPGQNDVAKKEIRIYIPGLFTEEINKSIQQDSEFQALQHINDMQSYGRLCLLNNGDMLNRDAAGNYYRNDELLTNQEDILAFERDIKEQYGYEAGKQIKFNHINNKNELNYETFNEESLIYAAQLSEELLGVPMRKMDGTPITPEDLHNILDGNYEGVDFNYKVYERVELIRKIWDMLKNDAYNYTKQISNKEN